MSEVWPIFQNKSFLKSRKMSIKIGIGRFARQKV